MIFDMLMLVNCKMGTFNSFAMLTLARRDWVHFWWTGCRWGYLKIGV